MESETPIHHLFDSIWRTPICENMSPLALLAGFEHKITVQASPSVDKRKNQGSESTTPPASPGVIPRLRAIRRECSDTQTRRQPGASRLPRARNLTCALLSPCGSVTPSDGSKTWGRSAVCKKEDLSANKKKGRTWGPSSTHQKERVGGEEKYVLMHLPVSGDAATFVKR